MNKSRNTTEELKSKYTKPHHLKLFEYLQLKGKSNTPERFVLIDLIYNSKKPCTVKDLGSKCSLSRQTLYQNIELFLECSLIAKVNDKAYIPTHGKKSYCVMLCNRCGRAAAFNNPDALSGSMANAAKGLIKTHITTYQYVDCMEGKEPDECTFNQKQ